MIAKENSVNPAFGLLIIMSAMGSAFALASLFPVLPAISDHFADVPYAPTLVRALVTSVAVAMVIGAPIAGFIDERFDTRKVLLVATIFFTMSGIAGFFIDNLWLLLASRLVLGFAEVTVSTTVLGLVATRLAPKQRNRWMGIFAASGAIGSLICIEMAGLIAHYSWRYVFLFYTIGLVIFACAAIALRDGAKERMPTEKQADTGHGVFAGLLLVLPLIGLGIASGAVENTTPIFLPFHLAEIGESAPSSIALAILPYTAANAISAFCYGYLRRFMSIAQTFVTAFLIAGLALIWIGTAQSYAMIVAGAPLLGLGVGMLAPNVYAYGAVYGSAAHQARNIGIVRGAFFIGSPLVQIPLEPVARFGNGMALATLGCISLLLMLWPLTRGRRMTGSTE